jgi:excisionase family DNA binding protein
VLNQSFARNGAFMENERYLRIGQLAKFLGVPSRVVRRAIADGLISVVRFFPGAHQVVPEKDLPAIREKLRSAGYAIRSSNE